MAELTVAEKRLLKYPPTPETWICQAKRVNRDTGESYRCDSVNSGSQKTCWCCHANRPRQPKLLWPAYLRACAKAQIEPKERVTWSHPTFASTCGAATPSTAPSNTATTKTRRKKS